MPFYQKKQQEEHVKAYLKALLSSDGAVESRCSDDNKKMAVSDYSKLSEAFTRAHDIRKFEIELFWKRAAHFWIFISVLFALFGTLLMTIMKEGAVEQGYVPYALFFLLLLNGIGVLVSVIWIWVMKGSKHWQQNWEMHIDMLESAFSGNLHKIWYYKSDELRHFSVSGLSLAVGWTFLSGWVLAYIASMLIAWNKFSTCFLGYGLVWITPAVLLLFALIFFYVTCRRPKDDEREKMENLFPEAQENSTQSL